LIGLLKVKARGYAVAVITESLVLIRPSTGDDGSGRLENTSVAQGIALYRPTAYFEAI